MTDKLSELIRKSVLNQYVDAEPVIRRWADEVAALEQRVERLEPYAVHKGYCITCIKGGGHYQTMASCDCGFKEALAEKAEPSIQPFYEEEA